MRDKVLHPIQAIIDAMSQEMAIERSRTQMTLGAAIKALEGVPPDTPTKIGALGSYRGYYSDLAFGSEGRRTRDARGLYSDYDPVTFEDIPDTVAPSKAIDEPRDISTVADLLEDARSALGACFEGYKGGDFWMTARTPLWVSDYGTASGQKVMGFEMRDSVLVPITESDDA